MDRWEKSRIKLKNCDSISLYKEEKKGNSLMIYDTFRYHHTIFREEAEGLRLICQRKIVFLNSKADEIYSPYFKETYMIYVIELNYFYNLLCQRIRSIENCEEKIAHISLACSDELVAQIVQKNLQPNLERIDREMKTTEQKLIEIERDLKRELPILSEYERNHLKQMAMF